MKLSCKITSFVLVATLSLSVLPTVALAAGTTTDEMAMYKNSDFIEKEQPELTEETKQLTRNRTHRKTTLPCVIWSSKITMQYWIKRKPNLLS